MSVEIIEHNELIANRRAPGDSWVMVNDSDSTIHSSLTKVLEAYFTKTGFKGSYRLDPLDSKLYAIKTKEEEIKVEEPQEYGIYGEISFRQGA